jgi:hypothetical protein
MTLSASVWSVDQPVVLVKHRAAVKLDCPQGQFERAGSFVSIAGGVLFNSFVPVVLRPGASGGLVQRSARQSALP